MAQDTRTSESLEDVQTGALSPADAAPPRFDTAPMWETLPGDAEYVQPAPFWVYDAAVPEAREKTIAIPQLQTAENIGEDP